jgi:hypothetical protein
MVKFDLEQQFEREEILAMGFILWFVLAISYIIKSNNNVAFSVYSVRKHY